MGSKKGRQKNRRIEFRLLKPGEHAEAAKAEEPAKADDTAAKSPAPALSPTK